MRNLTMAEVDFVSGGEGSCDAGSGGNDYLGGETPAGVGDALIAVYEGMVAAASHVIERVAEAL